MINAQMKQYDYYVYGQEDEYGQTILSDTKDGTIKMSINLLTKSIDGNQLYSSAEYLGLTHDTVSDKYVIQYNGEMLKVLYTNTFGRWTQVWMVRV